MLEHWGWHGPPAQIEGGSLASFKHSSSSTPLPCITHTILDCRRLQQHAWARGPPVPRSTARASYSRAGPAGGRA
eukprot:1134727-Prymnesium_polylepis.1